MKEFMVCVARPLRQKENKSFKVERKITLINLDVQIHTFFIPQRFVKSPS